MCEIVGNMSGFTIFHWTVGFGSLRGVLQPRDVTRDVNLALAKAVSCSADSGMVQVSVVVVRESVVDRVLY